MEIAIQRTSVPLNIQVCSYIRTKKFAGGLPPNDGRGKYREMYAPSRPATGYAHVNNHFPSSVGRGNDVCVQMSVRYNQHTLPEIIMELEKKPWKIMCLYKQVVNST